MLGPGIGATPSSMSGYWPLPSTWEMVPSAAEVSTVMATSLAPIPRRLLNDALPSAELVTAKPEWTMVAHPGEGLPPVASSNSTLVARPLRPLSLFT